ncbi:MAG: prephenate dehydrogenase/arogenate dehydrogenase family protein [Lachnospiraceae bacterium]|nr:prephenate dehydrogenase/arogenate dehydrogenase family protein [Lachnospiraceae bacterium]
MEMRRFGFIGFGLIGGSVAHALREQYPDSELLAYNYFISKPHPRLELAKMDGILDRITTDLSDFSDRDCIFLCAPVIKNIAYLDKLKPYLSKDCLLTDVGSVKSDILAAVREHGLCEQFVGGHPMTGSEKTGYEHSESSFFRDKYYVLTPFKESRPEYTEWLKSFVHDIGSHCMVLDANIHDAVVAGISHGPHVISAALVNTVAALDKEGTYAALAAGGFHGITRISSSSPEMWQNICLTNPERICEFLDKYIEILTAAKEQIAQADEEGLMDFFTAAKEYRDGVRF